MKKYKNVICRGSIRLGTGCGKCEKCKDERNQIVREDTGNVESNDKFVTLLYLIMRDHMPTGVVADIVRELEVDDGEHKYTNGYLANYSKYLVNRLENKDNE